MITRSSNIRSSLTVSSVKRQGCILDFGPIGDEVGNERAVRVVGRVPGVEGKIPRHSFAHPTIYTRHSTILGTLFDRLLAGTLQRAYAVGDVLAQARERATVSCSERVIALVRGCLAYGGAAGL